MPGPACSETMTCMNPDWWPLAGLRLQTPELGLRLASPSDLDALASLAADGVHDPPVQPFAFADKRAALAGPGRLGCPGAGSGRYASRGEAVRSVRLRLDRQTWQRPRTVPVTISGLEPCLPMLGVNLGHRG